MEIIKTILAGLFAALALALLPFMLLKILAAAVLFKIAFSLLGFGRHGCCGHHRMAHLTDEERKAFMEKYGHRCHTSQASQTPQS